MVNVGFLFFYQKLPNSFAKWLSHFTFPPGKRFSSLYISFSGARKKVKSLSRVRLFATPWTIAYQAPPSMRFSRQECWSGLPFPSPKYWSNRPQTLLFPPNKLQASQEPPGLVYKPVYTIASAIIL